jgi:hypothetical protein
MSWTNTSAGHGMGFVAGAIFLFPDRKQEMPM